MTAVFLDTVGLLAFWDKTDQWHDEATGALEKVAASGGVDDFNDLRTDGMR